MLYIPFFRHNKDKVKLEQQVIVYYNGMHSFLLTPCLCFYCIQTVVSSFKKDASNLAAHLYHLMAISS